MAKGSESWKEMVQEAVGDDKSLQKELVIGVAQFGEIAEALHWAHYYNVKREDWPVNVTLLYENKCVYWVNKDDYNWLH